MARRPRLFGPGVLYHVIGGPSGGRWDRGLTLTSILLKNHGSKNQEKIFRSQKLCNARSELG